MRNASKVLAIVLAICLCLAVVPVSASTGTETATITYRNITITLDGEAVQPATEGGAAVDPFILNDSTYLPLRAIANALGLGVDWDGATSTITLTSGAEKSAGPEVISGRDGTETAEITYRDIKIVLDGEEIVPKDEAGNPVEPFIMKDSTFLPVRGIASALGCAVEWDGATSAITISSKGGIVSVKAAGSVHPDMAKIDTLILTYPEDLDPASISAEDYEAEVWSTLTNASVQESTIYSGTPGKVLKAEVSGSTVTLTLDNNYLSSANAAPAANAAMAFAVKQVGEVKSAAGGTYGVGQARNYTKSTVEFRTPSGDIRQNIVVTSDPDSYTIAGIDKYELHYKASNANYNAAYPAFLAANCFEEATGESVDVELPYALFVPADYDAGQKYMLVVHILDAGSLGDDPLLTLCEAQGPMNFASDAVQKIAKDQGYGGVIVLAPQIEESLRSTRDNYTISAAVPATWQLVDSIMEKYSIDADRVYGTGQSMGGMQIMAMAAQRDNFFGGEWFLGMQWGNNYNKEEPYPERGGGFSTYYQSTDPTIWEKDDDGADADYGRNVYYLLSDDNVLLTNCAGDAFSTGVWKELDYLYQDIGGVALPKAQVSPLTDTLESQDAALEALLKEGDADAFNFHWLAFEGGGHMLTWAYGHSLTATYEWLLTQTRESAQKRGKLADLNNEWAAETDAAKLAAKQTADRAIGDGIYYAVPAEGAGTKGYNSCWFGMQGTPADDVHLPGWAPSKG